MSSSARSSFRKAQLEAKRNADAAKRKERELLFANRSQDINGLHPGRRKGQEKLTQDELALNASSDVTAALRRTHALLQSNIEQSQFAQQTLDESTSALASLSENYSNLDTLLKNSGGLMRQLIKSNKSDTWYLTTAFYILVVTLAWLIFRRILYGPTWWLLWQPLKLIWWLSATLLSTMGIVGRQKDRSGVAPGFMEHGTPGVACSATNSMASEAISPDGGGRNNQDTREPIATSKPRSQDNLGEEKDSKDVLEDISSMTAEVKGAQDSDRPDLPHRHDEASPPNPKKRVFERSSNLHSARGEL